MIATPGTHLEDSTLDVPVRDYAILKTIDAVKQQAPHDTVVEIDAGHRNFSELTADDTLYIAAHGSEAGLWGYKIDGTRVNITKADLTSWLNDEVTGLQSAISEVRLLACKQALSAGEDDASPVDYLATNLEMEGVTITGAKGFTFATTSSGESGLSRVIETGYYYTLMERDPVTWNGDVSDETITTRAAMLLKQKFASADHRAEFPDLTLVETAGEDDLVALQAMLVTLLVKLGNTEEAARESLADLDGLDDVKGVAEYCANTVLKNGGAFDNLREFLATRDDIYARIKALVVNAAGDTPDAIVANLRETEAWRTALEEQETLFDNWGLFFGGADDRDLVVLGYEQRTSDGVE